LLRALIQPTPTAGMDLHEVTLEIGIAVNHSTYDTLYLAFAIAMGASGVVVSDGDFVRDMQAHPDPALAGCSFRSMNGREGMALECDSPWSRRSSLPSTQTFCNGYRRLWLAP
jgi:hypothetical protein